MTPALRGALAGRMFFLQACWNFERMQNIGFACAIDPWLKRCYKSGGRLLSARRRHLELFNTQPYMAGVVLGLVCGLEEDAAALAEDEAQLARIRALKAGAASALAAIGDSLFWATLRPFCAAAALLLTLAAWPQLRHAAIGLGVAAYLAAFNAPALYLRWKGLAWGYQWKDQIAVKLKSFSWQRSITRLRLAGLGFTALAAAGWYFLTPAAVLLEPCASAVFLAGKLSAPALSAGRLYAAAVVAGALGFSAGWL